MKRNRIYGYAILLPVAGLYLCWLFWSAVVQDKGSFDPDLSDWTTFVLGLAVFIGGVFVLRKFRSWK